MAAAPLSEEERLALQHTNHYLMEQTGWRSVDLVAIGGACSGKTIRHFDSQKELEKFCEDHDLAFRTRNMT